MKLRFLPQVMIGLAAILMNTACASKATPTPANDMVVNIAMGVAVAETSNRRSANADPVCHSHLHSHSSHCHPHAWTDQAACHCGFFVLLVRAGLFLRFGEPHQGGQASAIDWNRKHTGLVYHHQPLLRSTLLDTCK